MLSQSSAHRDKCEPDKRDDDDEELMTSLCLFAGNVVLENLKVKENALVSLRPRPLSMMSSATVFLIADVR